LRLLAPPLLPYTTLFRSVTTVGRCIFNRILPDEVRWVNRTLDKKGVNQLVGQIYTRFGAEITVDVVDAIKDLGFKYATYSGATIDRKSTRLNSSHVKISY